MAKSDYLSYKRRERINFIDIAALRVIIDFTKSNKRPPKRDELFHRGTYDSIINDWLTEQNVDQIYALPITGSDQLDDTFTVLRKLGLIEQRGSYKPTAKGHSFFKRKGVGEDWHKWAISIPITKDKGEILWKLARYTPEF